MGICGRKECKKRSKAQNKGTNNKLYCTIACRVADGATQCEEAKAKKVSFNVCSLLLLLDLLLLTTLFHLSFPTEAAVRQGQFQEPCHEVRGTRG